jgi:hypothetical protein
VLLELGVVVDLEVRALVDAPREVVVLDLVLAVVRDVLRLRGARQQRQCERERGGDDGASVRQGPAARGMGDLES